MVFFVNDVVRVHDEILRAGGAPDRDPLRKLRGVVRRVNVFITKGSAPSVEVDWAREDGTRWTEITKPGALQLASRAE